MDNLLFVVVRSIPNILMPPTPPTHCHQPNWSTGDSRVLGRPSLERRAVCRRRKSRRRRRRSLRKEEEEQEEEERLMRKEEEADGDGPPVLVSAPLTLKVEVGKAIQEDIFLVSVPQRNNYFSSGQ